MKLSTQEFNLLLRIAGWILVLCWLIYLTVE